MADLKFDINDFRLDDDAVQNGVWVEFGGDASFKIAPFDNPSFEDAFRKANKPYNDLGRKPNDDEQEEIMCRTMSQFIVLGWKGVFDGDDELPYSQEAAYRLLTELPRIRAKIITEAQKLENFKAKAREATEGN
uniref:Pre-tape measure chaperone protein n=1 Tax=Dinoroseobacter phage vB_DshS_R26L TaxID=3161158 RepID=A0AAU7VGF3_9CAUD